MNNDTSYPLNTGTSNRYRFGSKRRQRELWFAAVLILPAILLLSLTIFVPLVKAILLSFTSYSLMAPDQSWNNFANYKEILQSSDFYHSFKITLIYVAIVVVLDNIIGLIFAVLLNSNIKLRSFFRSIMMIPWAIPTIVSALIFMWIYQPDYGVLNYVLTSTGIISDNINWLNSLDFALPSVMVVAIWRQTPLVGVMYLAGMQSIPKSLYEAGRIDGANSFQMYFRVTLPLLVPVMLSVSLMMIVTNFQMFALFYTLTQGGPVDATKSLAILTYETAFGAYKLGLGATIGVIWMIVLFSFSMIYTYFMNKALDH